MSSKHYYPTTTYPLILTISKILNKQYKEKKIYIIEMFEETIIPRDTKRYALSVEMLNKVIPHLHLLDEYKEQTIHIDDGDLRLSLKKSLIQNTYEIIALYTNRHNLMEKKRKKEITKSQYFKELKAYSFYIYNVENNLVYIHKELLKKNYYKKRNQFIYNNYWFKDFSNN